MFLALSESVFSANDSIYEARRAAYISTSLANFNDNAIIIQAYKGLPVDSASMASDLSGIASGSTSDFTIEQYVRILFFTHQYDSMILPVLLAQPYWVNKGDTVRCFWSENHMIQWMSSDWLLHESYGKYSDPNLRARLVHYLQMKIKYNYYEFFSTVYNPYCLAGILNLADFSQDTVVKSLAVQAAQLLMKDMLILTNDQGVIFPTAGRNYADHYDGAYGDNINSDIWLLTGFGQAPTSASHSGGFLSTSTIPVDPVVQSWVPTLDTTFIMGAQTLDSAYAYNSSLDSLDRIVFQWSAGAYFNPQFAAESFTLITDSNLWHNSVFSVFEPLSGLPVSNIPSISEHLGVASYSSILYSDTIVAFKHNSVTLSSVQNYWPGKWGYQQYPCVANVEYTAAYTGSGQVAYDWNNRSATNQNDDLPYVKQVKNVALIMYRPEYKPIVFGTSDSTVALHWYNGEYSEVRNDSLWLLGRVDNNYVGVRRAGLKQIDSVWCWDAGTPDGQTWIIIVGDSSMYGSFNNFQSIIDSSQFTTQWYYDSTANQVVYYASITIDSINIQHSWGIDTSTATGIVNIKTNDQSTVSIYPNPANTNVNLIFGSPPSNGQIEVYNILGELVYQSTINSSKISIATAQWGEGLYAVRISSDIGTVSKSIVISH
jgi:hypothetical protein